jgi:hypothetical protein
MTFHVGQKVVRVSTPHSSGTINRRVAEAHGATFPVFGQVYTVRLVRVDPDNKEVLLLVECDNSHMAGIGFGPLEPGFASHNFRPVVERKTDISIFTAMLDRTPSRETVEAS